MLPHDLRAYVENIDPFLPRCRRMELAIGVGVGLGKALYGSQQQHWLEWLDDHAKREAEGGAGQRPRTAELIYNRIMCPPMLYWLAEGAGVPEVYLDRAFAAVLDVPPRPASRCAALRWVIPWPTVEFALLNDGDAR